jgi:hypothetical protein
MAVRATSANNWPVIFDGDTTGAMPRLRKWYVPAGKGLTKGERWFYLRDGAAGFVLLHFILWFHETIERLDTQKLWDEWGWAVRPVRGQTRGYSNHASGTAADVNATVHPRGVSIWRTFKTWQIKAIHAWVKSTKYSGVLTWGGDWSTPDGMHIEIKEGVSLSKVERVARRLMLTPRGKRILEANPGAKKVILS